MATAASFEENVAAAGRHLARFAAEPVLNLIDGDATASISVETFANASPIDGRHLGRPTCG